MQENVVYINVQFHFLNHSLHLLAWPYKLVKSLGDVVYLKPLLREYDPCNTMFSCYIGVHI